VSSPLGQPGISDEEWMTIAATVGLSDAKRPEVEDAIYTFRHFRQAGEDCPDKKAIQKDLHDLARAASELRLRLSKVNPWTREAILEVVRPHHPTATDIQSSSVLDAAIEPALPADEVALIRESMRGTPHRDALMRFGQSLKSLHSLEKLLLQAEDQVQHVLPRARRNDPGDLIWLVTRLDQIAGSDGKGAIARTNYKDPKYVHYVTAAVTIADPSFKEGKKGIESAIRSVISTRREARGETRPAKPRDGNSSRN
jgi:hypothetical protein